MPSKSNPDALQKKREGGAEEGTKLSARAIPAGGAAREERRGEKRKKKEVNKEGRSGSTHKSSSKEGVQPASA